MCLKMFRKVSSVMHNSYSVTKVLHKHLKVLVIFCRSTNSVTTPGLILRNRNSSTEIGVQTDIKQNTATGSEHVVTNEKLLKRRKVAPDALYTVDRDVAKNLVDQIAQDIVKGGAPVFEVNPGLGFISRGLLAAGIQRLWLCESAVSFAQQMKELQNEFPERVKVLNKDLFMLAKLAYQDNMDGGSRVQSLFHGVPKAEWEDDPVMKIIGVLPSLSFIKHVIQSHVFQTGIIAYGRPEFYFIMSPAQYFYLTCRPGDGYFFYRSTSILFQLIFEWNLLEKLPRTGFLPWEAKHSIKKWSKLVKVQTIDPDFMYLVKIVPRRDFFRTVVSADQLQPLWFFVRHHLRSRKNRVIPQLEKWIPGCGPRIIMDGMTIFTEFGDLTPQEILSVFQKFVSWPEYPECPFLASMETTFMKMESATYNIEKDSDDEIEEVDEQS
ncbi:dimethyladenosine transferase 2, mitochondrial isoform X2 [Zootermopsis nevadensis]|uniref:dimethyladenosine transferase 2, mitochondrial isoform X2 n=1 Tax=Zootermopsis nevadensis TaxID=136037 RepID=UPI000B8E6AA2|nr:dimethyladenosine transferase 2, mitochondrial isoform X2 [Zootermopsis nevadensis]